MLHMSTATVRQLRHDFPVVERAARKNPVKITRRGKLIGTFTAVKGRQAAAWVLPDFTARSKAHFGERVVVDLVKSLADPDAP